MELLLMIAVCSDAFPVFCSRGGDMRNFEQPQRHSFGFQLRAVSRGRGPFGHVAAILTRTGVTPTVPE